MQENSPLDNPNLVKVYAADIKLGMYMSQPDRSWLDTSFMFQGFLVNNEKLLREVRTECEFIFIDKTKSVLQAAVGQLRPVEAPKANKGKPFEQHIENAYKEHQASLSEIKQVLHCIQRGEAINLTKIRDSVNACVVSIMDNPNAMLWLSKLRNRDYYTAEHSLNVGILAMALGNHLGFDRATLETLGLCGMLHDVGKMKLDQEVLNKPAKLSDEEFEIIKQHCALGKEILEKDTNLPKVSIEAAYSHHERIDGKGYPRGIKAETLSRHARIISIVDTYDAITTTRCYCDSRPATEAIKILFDGRGTQFDSALVEQFIECLGIYPTGSLVELHSGEGAVVIDSDKLNRLHPRVTIVLDENKSDCPPLLVNTLDYKTRPGGRTIKKPLDENQYHIDLQDVFDHFQSKW